MQIDQRLFSRLLEPYAKKVDAPLWVNMRRYKKLEQNDDSI